MNQNPVKQESPPKPSFLTRHSAAPLAYHATPGRLPGVVFLGGFRSDMTGSKALAVEAYCQAQGHRMVRFDYSGHGSSGGDFMSCGIDTWRTDVLDVLAHLAPGPNVLVGSSMGGWLMLLAALARPDQVRGLIGVSAAPDFTERLVWQQFSAIQQQELMARGVVYVPNCYADAEPYPMTRILIEQGRQHLLLDAPLLYHGSVRLLHGMEDKDVPWSLAQALTERLQSADVQLTLVKGAGHRLSEPRELELLTHTLGCMLAGMAH